MTSKYPETEKLIEMMYEGNFRDIDLRMQACEAQEEIETLLGIAVDYEKHLGISHEYKNQNKNFKTVSELINADSR